MAKSAILGIVASIIRCVIVTEVLGYKNDKRCGNGSFSLEKFVYSTLGMGPRLPLRLHLAHVTVGWRGDITSFDESEVCPRN